MIALTVRCWWLISLFEIWLLTVCLLLVGRIVHAQACPCNVHRLPPAPAAITCVCHSPRSLLRPPLLPELPRPPPAGGPPGSAPAPSPCSPANSGSPPRHLSHLLPLRHPPPNSGTPPPRRNGSQQTMLCQAAALPQYPAPTLCCSAKSGACLSASQAQRWYFSASWKRRKRAWVAPRFHE